MRTLLILTILVLFIVPFTVRAVDIIDGDLIRASNTFDVYIVKLIGDKKFKRLILNPEIFNQYGHLKWESIKDVDQEVVDQYTVSTLVRAVGDEKVYALYPSGDTGKKRWIKTADDFMDLGYDWDSVYSINTFERDFYITGLDLESPKLSKKEVVEEEKPVVPERDPITINVPSDYSTIQAAINAAIDGDTISVAQGAYNENIIINKEIKLIGETVGATVINGEGVDNAIEISAGKDILIQRLTVKSKDKYGIYCKGNEAITVVFKNNWIIDSAWGIVVEGNCQLTILNNLIYNNKNSANTDGGGILVKNNFSYGIISEIRNNTIDDNYHGIWSEDANLKVINNIISSNIGGKGTADSTGIYHSGQGESNNTFNDVWGNGYDYGGDAEAGNGSIVNDPRFVSAYLRDYRLRSGASGDTSPCIDKGHPDLIYKDGTYSDNTDRNDMGAYGGPDNVYW